MSKKEDLNQDTLLRATEVVRTVLGKKEFTIKYGEDNKTNGRDITLIPPSAYMQMKISEEEAIASVLMSAAHEAGHIQYTAFGLQGGKLRQEVNVVEDFRINKEVNKVQSAYMYWRTLNLKAIAPYMAEAHVSSSDYERRLRATLQVLEGVAEYFPASWAKWQKDERTLKAVKYVNSQTMTSTKDAIRVAEEVRNILKDDSEPEPEEENNQKKQQDTEGEGEQEELEQTKVFSDESIDNKESDSTDNDDGDSTDEDSDDEGDSESKDSENEGDSEKEDSPQDTDDDDDEADGSPADITNPLSQSMINSISQKAEKDVQDGKGSENWWYRYVRSSLNDTNAYNTLNNKNIKLAMDEHDKYFKNSDHEGLVIARTDRERAESRCGGRFIGAERHQAFMSTSEINQIRSALNNALQLRQATSESSESGRLDKQKLSKYKTDKTLFKTTGEDLGEFAVYVHLDGSGSMHGMRSWETHKVIHAVSTALFDLGIPTKVVSGYTFGRGVVLNTLKEWEEPFRLNSYYCTGCNRDGAYARIGAVDLAERPEENKILIMVSDGLPAGSINVNSSPKASDNTYERRTKKLLGTDVGYTIGYIHNGVDLCAESMTRDIRFARSKGIKVVALYVDLSKPELGRPLYGKDLISGESAIPETIKTRLVKYLENVFSM